MKKILPSLIALLFLSSTLPVWGQQEATGELPVYYPHFSWDKVPVYMHSGDRDGLSDEEVSFVATHCDFYCFEKAHGVDAHGYTEAGTEFDAQRLKAINPNICLLYYWNTFLDYPFAEAHQVYESHPEWWLYHQDGTLDLKNGRIKRYDLSNAEVREWWAREVRKAVINGSCDGVFMDAFPQITSEANIALWGQEKFDSIQEGLLELIRLTRELTDSSALLMFNGIRNTDALSFGMEYLDMTDAAAIEHFDHFASTSKESIQRDMEAVMEAGRRGKITILKTFPGFNWTDSEKMSEPYEDLLQEARENITFPLACYLVVAEPYSYFNYSWGYSPNFGTLEWYDELDRPLGEPLGAAVQDGWEYTREFEHVKVWVNIETREARIEWEGLSPLSGPVDSTIIDRSPEEAKDSLLFSFIPGYHSDSIPEYSGSSRFSTEYEPSGSQWHEQCMEEDVYHARLSHHRDPDSLLWDLRISKGGAIYSFIGPYGEGVPPQYRSWDFNTARWVDDLWQIVALSTERHNADVIPAPPGSTLGRPQVPSMRYFIHGAGVYMNDTLFARTNKPFYSPLMASWHDETNRSFHTMNWGQQAHVPSIHKSQLLYTYKYRDLGNGILENTLCIQNFGDHKVDYLNMPWGGVRAQNLPQCWLSHPNDSLERSYKLFGGEDGGLLDDIDQSGGYFIWAAEGEDENRPAMALVFGKDKHYEALRESHNMKSTRIRWGDGSGDPDRSYSVFTVNQRLDINPGTTFYYRIFYINGSMKEVHAMACSLVDASDYGFIKPDPDKTPLTMLGAEALDSAFTQDIKLFASPVEHMVPLFLMENTESGQQFISPDLYLDIDTLPFSNPYDPADPKYDGYQDQVVYRPYTGKLKFIRLLGYGVNKSQLTPHIRFALLDSLVRDTTRVILSGAYKNCVWIPLEPCDTCESVPEPEPGFLLYNDFGADQRFPWTDPVNIDFKDYVPNPDPSENNPSELAGKLIRGPGKWANVHFDLPETLDLSSYSTFKVKVYYEGSDPVPDICKVRLILRNNGLGLTQYSLEQPVALANQWVEYTFQCAGALGRDDYNQVWLFFSSPDDENIAVGHTYYIDDLMGPPVGVGLDKYTLTFAVMNEDSGGRLSGVPVSIGGQTKTTDLQGNSAFVLWEGAYNYTIENTGYFPVEAGLLLSKDTVAHIGLIESTSNLKFRIYADDSPISMASVEVDGSMLQTNTVGIALFEDLPRFESYSYSVEKEGYQSEKGLFSLNGDTTINLMLQIIASTEASRAASIRLYPNPVLSKLCLDSDIEIKHLELYTSGGILVQVCKPGGSPLTMDLAERPSGFYLLKIHPEKGLPLMKRIMLSK